MSHHLQAWQQKLERVSQVALLVFVICSVISISAMQAAYILALVAWVVRLALPGSKRQISLPLFVPICSFLLASILATLTAINPYRSLIELRSVLAVSVLYLVVNHVRTKEHATTLIRVLIATGTLMALYGLSQSLTEGADFRIYGTMSIYVTFASLLMLISSMTLAQLLFHGRSQRVLWYVPALLLLIAALLMTQSRGTWLGLGAGFCVALGLRKKFLLLTLPLMAVVAFLIVPSPIQARFRDVLNPQQTTARERLYVWHSGLQLIRSSPWTGVGLRNVPRSTLEYRDPQNPGVSNRHLTHLHNNLLQIAAERGLIGLVCWLALWVAYFRQAWLCYRSLPPQDREGKALVVGSLASVTSFQIAGMFDYDFGDAEVITLVYFLMAFPFLTPRLRGSTTALAAPLSEHT
jgi:O-antigen ligase